MARTPENEAERAPDQAPESRSARKRAALAAQQLGEELIQLDDGELAALALPEMLVEALREARRIRSRSAGARQRQYIGRLMRDIDADAIRSALEARRARAALAVRELRELESWRARLIAGGQGALEELAARFPQLERSLWQRVVADARAEHTAEDAGGGARRRLLRMLRALFAVQ